MISFFTCKLPLLIHTRGILCFCFTRIICLHDGTAHNSQVSVLAFRRGACHVAQAAGLLGKNGCEGDGWGHVFETLQNPCASFSSFKIGNWTEKNNIIDLPGMKSSLVLNATQIVDRLRRVGHFGPWDRGTCLEFLQFESVLKCFLLWKNQICTFFIKILVFLFSSSCQ